MKFPLTCVLLSIAVLTGRGADFVVTNTNSTGPGSLHQTITSANNLPGPDRILFNIPGPGVHKIKAGQSRLPAIYESLTIDGYSQPGAKPNSLAGGNNAIILIQIDGLDATATGRGLSLERGGGPDGQTMLASNYVVRGLSLTGFSAEQTISFPPATYRSTALAAWGNVDSAVITGNFIGLLPDGETAGPNGLGVAVSHSGATNVTVGGTDPASRNVISGNTRCGWSGGGRLLGNYIGTNARGTRAIPNQRGLFLVGDGTASMIGGTAAGSGNLISGNTVGIYFGDIYVNPNAPSFFIETPGSNFRIKGNAIGVQADGISPLANGYPIQFLWGSNNIIGGLEPGAGNLIAFNGSGIKLARPYVNRRGGGPGPPSDGNQILSNAIYANGDLPIDLASNGSTPNDPGDADFGPNSMQNAPVITSSTVANGSATITGTLHSTADTQFTLQYFSESLDLVLPVQTLLGTTTVSTDANGNASFSGTFPISDTNVSFNMTATSQIGNTSEFARSAGRMQNISTRTRVQPGEKATIAGFIVNESAYLVLRALGPSLQAFGLPGVLPDPVLEVYDSTGKLIISNDNWRESPNASVIEGYGLAPTNDWESALTVVVEAGNYTAVVRDHQGRAGLALVEVYSRQFSPLQIPGFPLNLSTRAFVQTGNNVMIAGLIIEPVDGSSRIVARALGPSLTEAGITDPLQDPVLELRDSQGALIALNDNWQAGQASGALTEVGLAPTDASEAAIFLRLPSGAYTAIVGGKGATGVGVVEWYNLH